MFTKYAIEIHIFFSECNIQSTESQWKFNFGYIYDVFEWAEHSIEKYFL